ncbi:MAG TPA: hypothetical protein VFE50_13745 [Cyclobacteriaceae bacterium]|nr:hypothetical protein [Cyclobacteriaceae bacterium]
MEPIPEQHTGNQTDIRQTLDASTPRQAHSNFVEASRRLLDVNNWHDLAGTPSASFQLTDKNGMKLDRLAKVGDYIRIDIPGPGLATGHGYDWVIVESVEDKPNPGSDHEYLVMNVRPAPSPVNDETDVAHFFDDRATSSFMVERKDLQVSASEHGRNEHPNTHVDRATDKIRNALVAGAATSGVSGIQWNLLMKGILKDL